MLERFRINSPSGKLAAELLLPEGFNPAGERSTLVLMMHGFLGGKEKIPMDFLGRVLHEGGYPLLRFDFDGYGESEGAPQDNTVPAMLDDAKAVWDYAVTLPFVEKIVILAHSQGGLVAGMLAGRLEKAGTPPAALILFAPASILREFARRGRFFTVRCDPANPPAVIPVYGFNMGREFILTAQNLPIEQESSRFTGPVCLLHGNIDLLVPVSCSKFYHKLFKNSEFHRICGSGHLFLVNRRKVRDIVLGFLGKVSGRSAYEVRGPHGGISTVLTLPDNFDAGKDKCPLVILMHGFISKKELYPLPAIAEALSKEGIASIRFDFDAHGKSEGKFVDMTVSSEIADAKSVLDYARRLPFVTKIALLGHSQGGVVAGMLAGEMENNSARPDCLVQLAPAAVLKDDAIAGKCMYAKYDASNPPEYVSVFFHKLGRQFILEAQKLPIYETSCKYSGPVLIVQGENDKIVPVSYSEKYHELYKNSELCILQREGHMLNGDKRRLLDKLTGFIKDNLG